MQYHCVQCDEQFEVDDGGADKPRCPKCLRQFGLRELEASTRDKPKGQGVLVLGLLLVAALAAGGYYGFRAWRTAQLQGPVPLEPLDGEEVASRAALRGVQESTDAPSFFDADAKVRAFAKQAVGAAESDDAKAKALVDALAARAKAGAFLPWPRSDVRAGGPQLPAQVVETLAKDDGKAELYPLEVAMLGMSALRSVGVPALLAEVYRYEGERSPLDPSGRLGYYAVALRGEDDAPARVYDVFGARSVQPNASDFVVLDDLQAYGALRSLSAIDALANDNDSRAALVDSGAAVSLLPTSPSVRSVRAAALLTSGGTLEGVRELEAAFGLRADAPRRNNLALLELARGQTDGAAKQVAAALAQLPDYASAHLTLASVHLSRGERELGRAELQAAERLDPTLSALPLAWAELLASSGDLGQALVHAERAVDKRPNSPEARLVLGRLYRQLGRYDDMRKQAQAILKVTQAADQERMKTVLLSVFGATALEAPIEVETSDEGPVGGEAAGDAKPFQLSQPGAGTSSPLPSEPGSLKLGSGEPKLRLGGDEGTKLKLEL